MQTCPDDNRRSRLRFITRQDQARAGKKSVQSQCCNYLAADAVFISTSRRATRGSTSIFRVLVKTLFKAGIVTNRTIHVYTAWLDTEGDAIAAEGVEYLREINRKRRRIGQKSSAFSRTRVEAAERQ